MTEITSDKTADLAGSGISTYEEVARILPTGYHPLLPPKETQIAVAAVKRFIEDGLCRELNLIRVEVPLIVDKDSGVNDYLDRDGSRTPIDFPCGLGLEKRIEAQVVQAATKWKRMALKTFGMDVGEGLVTDMRAVRKDYFLDHDHSADVDQWDWERVMTADQRNLGFLTDVVQRIWNGRHPAPTHVRIHGMRRSPAMVLPAIVALAVLGCATQPTDLSGSISAPIQDKAAQQLPKPDPKAVELFVSYLKARNGSLSAVPPIDKRPPQEIAADLRTLPKKQLLGLRAYTLDHPYLAWEALDLLGQLLPEGHREFLLRSLEAKGWASYAIPRLVALDDPSVVGPILDRAEPVGVRGLKLLAPLAIPTFLDAVRRKHSEDPTAPTAFVLGCYGNRAETDIRRCAASKDEDLRRSALYGLSKSQDPGSLPLLLELADLSGDAEWGPVADRFVSEGEIHVDKLLVWLAGPPEKERVAAYALARIPSEIGVSRVLARYQYQPYENALAGSAAKSSPKAAREFVADRVIRGTRVQKRNALLVAHHLAGDDPPVPGKEHALLKPLLLATHDSDVEVRREAAQQIVRYARDAHFPEGRKALRRLVEMLRDPSPRVRAESAIQASQYPSPEVLALLKRMAADKGEDPEVRETAKRAAGGLERRLLKPMGRKPVSLAGGG